MPELNPSDTLDAVAKAIPTSIRGQLIVAGSLSAAVQFFPRGQAVRTKDVDCVLTPQTVAVSDAQEIVRALREANWSYRDSGEFGNPCSSATDVARLPNVRMCPPGCTDWFLEILSVPSESQFEIERFPVQVEDGYLCVTAFRHMGLVAYRPNSTGLPMPCARPVMMALANLLSHPTIGNQVMNEPIGGQVCKRANKDLGRVVALALLSGADTVEQDWARDSWQALQVQFPSDASTLVRSNSDGLQALLNSETDMEEAWHTAKHGLLSPVPHYSRIDFRLACLRAQQDFVEELRKLASL